MKRNGFTLIELFVVLTIVAFFFVLAIPNYIADQHKMDAQLARQQLFLDLRQIRLQAVKLQYPTTLYFNTNHSYEILEYTENQNGVWAQTPTIVKTVNFNSIYSQISVAQAGGKIVFSPSGMVDTGNTTLKPLKNSNGFIYYSITIQVQEGSYPLWVYSNGTTALLRNLYN